MQLIGKPEISRPPRPPRPGIPGSRRPVDVLGSEHRNLNAKRATPALNPKLHISEPTLRAGFLAWGLEFVVQCTADLCRPDVPHAYTGLHTILRTSAFRGHFLDLSHTCV